MLSQIKVRHFRCFDAFEAEFGPGLNFIVGPNAQGKTSLIEAVAILLRLQSPRLSRLAFAVQHERRGFVVDGIFDRRHLQFYFSKDRKKLALDSVPQTRAGEYLQVARVMWFANSDIEITRGSAEARRRFMDFVAAQIEPGYRAAVRDYERALRSRNLLLKASPPRWREIAAFDEPLIETGQRITSARQRLIAALSEPVKDAHGAISGGAHEELRCEYVAGSGDDFADALHAARKDDARWRQTSVGPHRDDVNFFLNGVSSTFASEGQQRTLVLALKLAAAHLLADHFTTPPLLLLDDTFGELDVARRNALLASLPTASQKLITTTHLDWMPDATAERVIRIGDENGTVSP